MKRLVMLTLFALSLTTLSAQTWVQWRSAPPGTRISSIEGSVGLEEGNKLTVAYKTSAGIEFRYYNGFSWTTMPSISDNNGPVKLIRYQGSLYYLSFRKLWRLDGKIWTMVWSATGSDLMDMEVYNGLLLLAGGRNIGVQSYNGQVVGSFTSLPAASDVLDLYVKGTDLYVATKHSLPLQTNRLPGLIKYDGNNWSDAARYLPATVPPLYSGGTKTIFELKGKMYVVDTNGVGELLNDSIIPVATFPLSLDFFRHVKYEAFVKNDTAYFGEGYRSYSTSSTNIKAFDGNSIIVFAGSPSKIVSFVGYQNRVLAMGDGLRSIHMIWTRASNLGSLDLDLFWDKNQDCQLDSGDTLVNLFVSLNNGQVVLTSSPNQVIQLKAGTYTIDSIYSFSAWGRHLFRTCNVLNSFTITAGAKTLVEIPFSLRQVDDLSVSLVSHMGWRSLYGFHQPYQVVLENVGSTTQQNVTLNFNYNPNMSLIRLSPSATSSVAGTASWNIGQIKSGERMYFNIWLRAFIPFSLGDSLCFTAHVDSINDVYPQDNADKLIQTVVGAYDPNDKQVSATRVLPSTKRVDYQINFQNMGTDTAHKVTVVDTLDWSLPVNKIFINSASHPYSFSVKGNILIWEFDNIMLPDSGADYAGSQGYVRFSAGINPSVAIGDTIENDADIYFDYQPPVPTPKAKTAVVQWISLPEIENWDVHIYPNPAKEVLNIRNGEAADLYFQLFNSTGLLVQEFSVKQNRKAQIDLNSLSAGVYILKTNKASYKVIVSN